MFEIEKRAVLSEERYKELISTLSTKGNLLKTFDRTSYIYIWREDWQPGISSKIDFKIRIDGKSGTVALKKTLDNSLTAREEIEFSFDSTEIRSILKTFHLLGFSRYIVEHKTRHKFLYNNMDVTLDYHHTINERILEAELMAETKEKFPAVEARLDEFFKEFELEILSEQETLEILKKINNAEEWRVDLSKDEVDSFLDKLAK